MTINSLRTLTLMLAGSLTLTLACGGDDGDSATDASTGGATEPATTGGHSSTSSVTDVATTDGSDATTNIATTDGSDATTNIATTDGSDATSEVSSSGGTGDPDPDHVRECQKEDFVCSDWGCENLPHVKLSQCYKRCTPDEIGGPDAECDEPERPFCSQVGQAFGGDFDCNGCAHICVSAVINQCDQDVASCE